MKGWPEVFNTMDKSAIEHECAQEGEKVQWVGPNQDTFVSKWISEPYQLHPITKEPVWFNHVQVFHWSSFSDELYYAWKRTNNVRFLIHYLFVFFFNYIKYVILEHKMSLNVTFGDGTPISVEECREVRSAVHKNNIYNRWEKGDVLLIDNFGCSHGRQPTYDKGRKVVVSWSDPIVKANELTSISAHVEKVKYIPQENINKADVDAVDDFTQTSLTEENERTLTYDEIHELKGFDHSNSISMTTSSTQSSISSPDFWKKDN